MNEFSQVMWWFPDRKKRTYSAIVSSLPSFSSINRFIYTWKKRRILRISCNIMYYHDDNDNDGCSVMIIIMLMMKILFVTVMLCGRRLTGMLCKSMFLGVSYQENKVTVYWLSCGSLLQSGKYWFFSWIMLKYLSAVLFVTCAAFETHILVAYDYVMCIGWDFLNHIPGLANLWSVFDDHVPSLLTWVFFCSTVPDNLKFVAETTKQSINY